MGVSGNDAGVSETEEMGTSDDSRLFVAFVFYIVAWPMRACEICISFYDHKSRTGLHDSGVLQQRTEQIISVMGERKRLL